MGPCKGTMGSEGHGDLSPIRGNRRSDLCGPSYNLGLSLDMSGPVCFRSSLQHGVLSAAGRPAPLRVRELFFL